MKEKNTFTPLLTTTDWNQEWMQLQKNRKAADSSAYWDERSKTFGHKNTPSTYVKDFLEHSNLKSGDVVFDMGCGNGALAIPLAMEGHKVIAADFSRGMLNSLEATAKEHGVSHLISTIQISWDDAWTDWQNAGISENMADVAFASRSIATANLQNSLERLTCVAKRKCCITLSTGASPRLDEQILEDLGLQAQLGRDFLYAFNILAGMGLHPSVAYLNNSRHDTYETRAEAEESLNRMLEDIKRKLPESEHAALDARFKVWVSENLCEHKFSECEKEEGAVAGADGSKEVAEGKVANKNADEGKGTDKDKDANEGKDADKDKEADKGKAIFSDVNTEQSQKNTACANSTATYWQLKHPRKTQWALISWEVGL